MLRVTRWPRRALAFGLVAFACPLGLRAQEIPAPAPVVVRELPVPAPVAAPERPAPSGESLLAGEGLRPGQYRWHPELAPADGPVAIVVSLPLQRAWVFRGGVAIGVSTVSSGQPGYDTPIGAFRILEKDVDHHSSLYDNAPMPFMLRLTWDGVALHGGKVVAEPASHGCVRLPHGFARHLFEATPVGSRVVITDEAPGSAQEALALVADGGAGTATASAD